MLKKSPAKLFTEQNFGFFEKIKFVPISTGHSLNSMRNQCFCK